MRFFLITVAAILAVSMGAFFYFSDPDIPRATLELKYATPPSQFVQLADGTRAHVRDRGQARRLRFALAPRGRCAHGARAAVPAAGRAAHRAGAHNRRSKPVLPAVPCTCGERLIVRGVMRPARLTVPTNLSPCWRDRCACVMCGAERPRRAWRMRSAASPRSDVGTSQPTGARAAGNQQGRRSKDGRGARTLFSGRAARQHEPKVPLDRDRSVLACARHRSRTRSARPIRTATCTSQRATTARAAAGTQAHTIDALLLWLRMEQLQRYPERLRAIDVGVRAGIVVVASLV
jgi:hypothetical protein